MPLTDSRWDGDARLLETRLSGRTDAADVAVWQRSLIDALAGAPERATFGLLADLSGYDPATADDADAIATVHVRSWQAAYRGIVPDAHLDRLSIDRRAATWRESLANRPPDVFVAEREGRMLGWISVGKSRDADADSNTGEL